MRVILIWVSYMSETNWTTVQVRKDLIEASRAVIEQRPDLGYSNATRFVEDAVRRRLEDIYATLPTTG